MHIDDYIAFHVNDENPKILATVNTWRGIRSSEAPEPPRQLLPSLNGITNGRWLTGPWRSMTEHPVSGIPLSNILEAAHVQTGKFANYSD